jgi:TRAP-type C4-dicarboxylate transport system substrate-binding protein
MKKECLLMTAGSLCLILTVTLLPFITAYAKPIGLKMALYLPDTPGSDRDSMKWWINEVEKRTQGKVQITSYWGGALAKTMELLEVVRAGTVDMSWMIASYFPAEFPIITVGGGPAKFKYSHAPAAVRAWLQLYKEFPEFEAEFTAQNIKLITQVGIASPHLVSNKPIRNLADMKGLKVRSGGKYVPKIMAAAGCVPVSMPVIEAYDALKKNLIDMTSVGFDLIKRYRLYEVCQYISTIDMGAVASVNGLTINLNVWNKLPKDVQRVMLDVGEEFYDVWAKKHYEEMDGIEKFLKVQGMKIIEFPPAEREKWSKLPGVIKVTDDWIAERERKGLPGRKVVERWVELEPEMEARYGPKK